MMYENGTRMKVMKEMDAKSIAGEENTPPIVGMPDESIKLFDYVKKIMNMEYLIQSMEDVVNEIRSDNHYLTPEIGDMLVGCSTRLEEFTSGIVEGSKSDDDSDDSDDSDTEVMKLKMVNPSVRVEGYDGPLHVLKSLWEDGKQFSINLRFDCNSFNDLQKLVDYFTDLTEKVDTVNHPFTTCKYVTNLDVEFSKAAIVKGE
jgi:hypothetical protein